MLKIFRNIRFGLLLSLIIVLATIVLKREINNLPQLPKAKFWEPSLSSRLLDRKGNLIFEYALEKRDYLPIQRIPKPMIQAVVAIEDERFYHHWGLDTKSLARAIWTNFVHGRVVQGGSTLTQQLAKNLFLTREKHLRRKIRELLLALYIERNLSKNEILEMYLNQVYLGHGAYGVSQGAQTFFNKDIATINVSEAAFLAGLIKAPGSYSPWRNPQAARTRGKVVLKRMEELGVISTKAYEQATKTEVAVSSRTLGLPAQFAHFIEYIRQDIEERYSPELLWKGGLQIETTIDTKYQNKAFDALRTAADNFDQSRSAWELSRGNVVYATSTMKIEAAYLMMESKTGAILSWIGGKDFKNSQFNRVYQSKRQPGSAFKPFVWLAALQHNLTPATIYEDLPMAYTYDGRTWRLVPGSTDFYTIHQATASLAPEMAWVPDNFDNKYMGPITLRRALALSRNLVSIRLVDDVGPAQVVALAHQAGITSRLEPVLSLGLGTVEVSLLELVNAYQTISNTGVRAKPYAITRITKSTTGEVLEENRPQLSEVINPALTYVLVDMMKSVVTEGTARYASKRIHHPLAGKTGTTQDNRDVWFLGFTPEIVAGAWMGYDNFEPLGKKDATGGSTVVPWWTDIMQTVLKDYPSRDFGPPPEGINFQKICVMSGKLAKGTCPKVRLEVFLKDTAPQEFCDLQSHEAPPILTKPTTQYVDQQDKEKEDDAEPH